MTRPRNNVLFRPLLLLILTAGMLLTASPAAAQCNPSLEDCAGTPTAGPDIGMSPDGGTWTVDGGSVTVPVSVYMTDADGLNASTRDARLWNGNSSVPLSLNWTTNANGTSGTLSGNLVLTNAGDNILVVQIADRLGNVGRGSATFRLNFTEPGLPVVSLEPHHSEYRNTAQGAFLLGHPAPSYTSMDADRAVALVYNSEQARITGFVQVDARPDPGNAASVIAMSLRIEQWTAGATGTQPLIGKESFYAKGDGGFQRLAVHWLMGENLPTGAYKYWAVVRAYRSATVWTERRNLVRMLVINEKTSRYGAGWSLAGIQRLHSTADGLLLNEGNGVARFFKGGSSNGMCTGGPCTYETPAGDFSVLQYRPESSTWARTYPDGSQVVFDQSGVMRSASDRFGNATTYEWQSTGGIWVLSRIVDPVGHATNFAYDTSGYLRSITAAGRTLTCAYNASNQLTSISGPPNLQVTYNASHQLLAYTTNFSTGSFTDPGATSNLTYDEFRQLRTFKAAMVLASGTMQQPKTTWRSLPWRTAPSPNVTYSVTSPAPAQASTAVSVQIIDPRIHTTEISVDRYGNPTKVVDPEGLTTTMTWTAEGLPSSVATPTDSSGYAWNQKGQLLVQTVGGSIVYEASYNAQNLPEFVASGGSALWYAYGSRGEVVRSWPGKKEDSLRTGTTYEYNARYQLIKTVGPKGEKVEWSYEGNPWRNADYARVTREDGIVLTTSYTYDARSRPRTVTNPLQQTVTTEYDDYDRPVRVFDPTGRFTSYEYTGPHLTKVTDPGSKTFVFTYNALGWLQSEQFPGDGTSRTYTYNADGLVLSVTNRLGQPVTFTYNGSHRLLDRTADGITTSFRYPDAYTTVVSNPESVVTAKLIAGVGTLGSVSSTVAGRRFEIKRAIDTNNAWRDVGFDLNTFVNETLQRTEKVRYHTEFNPADTSLSSTYQIEDMSGYRTTMAFDTSGRPVRTAFPNGVTQYNWFTSDGRLDSTTFSSLSANQKLGATFAYDALGRLSTRTSRLEDRQWQYGYDGLGRVTQYGRYQQGNNGNCDPSWQDCPPPGWVPVATEEYTYDPSGNRTDRGGFTEIGSNRYTDFNGFTFTYDAEGNLKSKTKSGFVQTFAWNALGQLTAVTTNGSTVTYGYDGLGSRVRRTESGQSRYYVYDGDDLLLETDHYGNPIHTYTHWPGVDRPHSVRVTSFGQNFVYYYTTERPGHVTGLLNTLGQVAGEHHYKPFGEVESATDDAGQPLRFMGRELDFTTGLYYVRNRWYDPAIARFVSQDPIGMDGGLNTYVYAGNDPVNGRDPSGLRTERDPCERYPWMNMCRTSFNNPFRLPSVWVDAYSPDRGNDDGKYHDFGFGPERVGEASGGSRPSEQERWPTRPRGVNLDCSATGYEQQAAIGGTVGGALGAGVGWLKGGGWVIVSVGVLGTVVAGPAAGWALAVGFNNSTPLGASAARSAIAGGISGIATGAAGAMTQHGVYCGDLPNPGR